MVRADIPAIIVDDFPTTPPMMTRDITSPYQTPIHRSLDGNDTPMAIMPGILQSPDVLYTLDDLPLDMMFEAAEEGGD